ncbi:MAG: FG-GAP repeat domain-containing protein [Phycisphaerae bacterium]
MLNSMVRDSLRIQYLVMLATLVVSGGVFAQQFVDETSTRFPSPNPTDYTNQLTIGDIDNDNDLDIIFANGPGFSSPGTPEVLRIFVNDGTGVFTDNTLSATGNFSGWFRGVEMGDADNDGDLDLIAVQDFGELPRLLINNGNGRFESAQTFRLPDIELSSSRAQFGDIDNDGDLDLFLTSGTTSRFTCGQYRVYENDGKGFYTDVTATNFPVGSVCNNMDCIFGDIDNDFDIDIRTASTGNNNSRLYKNDGTGVFTQVASPSDSTCYSYDFGDIDGDGDLDLLGANGLSGSSSDILLENDGTGVYTNVSSNISSNFNVDDNDSKFFDYDNDGHLDLLIGRIGGVERIYRNDGAGNFTLTSGVLNSANDSTLDVMVADLNNDGRLDIVTGQGESGNYQNRIYMNTGPQDTRAPRIIRTEQHPDTTEPGPYVVRALILDDMTSDRNFFDKGIFVNYTVNGGELQQVEMKFSGGQVYRGAIPNQPGKITIEYYVTATDYNNNTGTGDTLSFNASGGDIAMAPMAEDSLAADCDNDEACANSSVCRGGRCYVPKNRFLSVASNPLNAAATARRVSLDLGGSTQVLGWMGQPDGDGLSRIEDTPVFLDWSGQGVVQLGDCEIVPGTQYLVENIFEGVDVGNEQLYSEPLALPTVAVWGDVKGGSGSPPNGVANFEDIQECVLGFQASSQLPVTWLDLDPQAPNLTINFADVQMTVLGFQVQGYPFSAPADCP